MYPWYTSQIKDGPLFILLSVVRMVCSLTDVIAMNVRFCWGELLHTQDLSQKTLLPGTAIIAGEVIE